MTASLVKKLKSLLAKQGNGLKTTHSFLTNTVGLLGSLVFLLFGMLSISGTNLAVQVGNNEPHIIAFPVIVGIPLLAIGITGMASCFWDTPISQIVAWFRKRRSEENEYLIKTRATRGEQL